MHKLYYIVCVVAIIVITQIFSVPTHATSQNVVISQVQLGNTLSAKNEFIEIYNNSVDDVDITDWCLYYQSSSLKTEKLACFIADNAQTHIFLPGKLTALVVSSDLLILPKPLIGDLTFSATLSGAAGYVFISDNKGAQVDKVGWGVATTELDLALAAPNGEVISRKRVDETNLLQDTDVNIDDFDITAPKDIYIYDSIYKVYDVCKNIEAIQEKIPDGYYADINDDCLLAPVDLCLNLEGLQVIVPDGYELDSGGNCQIDICKNINEIQLTLSDNMIQNESGDCIEIDYCPNLTQTQTAVPPGYYLSEFGECKLVVLELQINEVLPNVTGVDDGKEFIEIYNPNDTDVSLSSYMISVGANDSEKYFEFPADSIIKAFGYHAQYNLDVLFTLKNTNDAVRLYSADLVLIDEMAVYNEPKVDEAWAKINGSWTYTNRPSPGGDNLEFLQDIKEKVVDDNVELAPCGINQYRSSETNRCRNIVSSESVLAPCKDGQYRSEETKRCRNIVSDVVEYMPCAEGEERNPETNRCRAVASAVLGASDLAPCPEGQERNPETNRCRKVISEIPTAEYKTEPVSQSGGNNILWWSLGGVGIMAIVYAIWEWRREIVRLVQKIGLLVHRNNN